MTDLFNLFFAQTADSDSLSQGKLADSYRDFYLGQKEGFVYFNGQRRLTKNEQEFQQKLQEYSTLYKINSDAYLNPRLQRPDDKEVNRSLKILNTQLIELAQKISADMDLIAPTQPSSLRKKIRDQQGEMRRYIKSLHKERTKLHTITGLQEHTSLFANSNYYHYIAWFLLTLTIILAILIGAPVLILSLLLLFLVVVKIFS